MTDTHEQAITDDELLAGSHKARAEKAEAETAKLQSGIREVEAEIQRTLNCWNLGDCNTDDLANTLDFALWQVRRLLEVSNKD